MHHPLKFVPLPRKHPIGTFKVYIVDLSLRSLRVVCTFQSVRIGHGLRFNIRLSENFVKGVGLLDSEEANTKDQGKSENSHNNTPNAESEKEQGDNEVHNVASTEGEEGLENLGVFQPCNNRVGRLNGNTQHNKAYEADEGSTDEVKVNPSGCEIYGHGNVELKNRHCRRSKQSLKRKRAL